MTEGVQEANGSSHLRHVRFDRYGSPEVLTLKPLSPPTPGRDELVIRIHASSVSSADVNMRSACARRLLWRCARLVLGVFRPRHRTPGVEYVGTVLEIGAAVGNWRVGERVFGTSAFGANADRLLVSASSVIARAPERLTNAEAAVTPFGALTADHVVEACGRVRRGDRVLVVGASGCVGLFVVQIARNLGADVSAVCSGTNGELVRSFGADAVIDYRTSDAFVGTARYDVIIDTTGSVSWRRARRVLTRRGRLVVLVFGFRELLLAQVLSLRRGPRLVCAVAEETADDLLEISRAVEAGRLTPALDRIYALTEIVEAHRYVETGRKLGGVALDHERLGT